QFNPLTKGSQGAGGFKCQRDVPDVDKVEAHDQQVINGVCEVRVAVEGVQQKDPAAPVKRSCDPDGKNDADDKIAGEAHCDIHITFPHNSKDLNTFNSKH